MDKKEVFFTIVACMYPDAKAIKDEGDLCIDFQNGYSIYMEHDSDQFELYREVVTPGTYWEPEDVDIAIVTSSASPWCIVKKMEICIKEDELENLFDNMSIEMALTETIFD
jgi:hypothetical protein